MEEYTQSEMSTWDECPQKWFWYYYRRLTPRGDWAWPLAVGTIWHKLMEAYYNDLSTDSILHDRCFHDMADEDVLIDKAFDSQAVHWIKVIEALYEAYQSIYHELGDEPEMVETVLKVKNKEYNIIQSGMIDLVVKNPEGRRILRDFKTAARFDDRYDQGWKIKFQFLWYVYLASEDGIQIDEYSVRMVKKPALRLKTNETQQAFTLRCVQDIKQNPDEYFQDIPPVQITPELMENFYRYTVKPKLERIKEVTKSLDKGKYHFAGLNRNTNACFNYGKPCPFLKLCENGDEISNYNVREHKHRELEEA